MTKKPSKKTKDQSNMAGARPRGADGVRRLRPCSRCVHGALHNGTDLGGGRGRVALERVGRERPRRVQRCGAAIAVLLNRPTAMASTAGSRLGVVAVKVDAAAPRALGGVVLVLKW